MQNEINFDAILAGPPTASDIAALRAYQEETRRQNAETDIRAASAAVTKPSEPHPADVRRQNRKTLAELLGEPDEAAKARMLAARGRFRAAA